jgi:hypothetical protein
MLATNNLSGYKTGYNFFEVATSLIDNDISGYTLYSEPEAIIDKAFIINDLNAKWLTLMGCEFCQENDLKPSQRPHGLGVRRQAKRDAAFE